MEELLALKGYANDSVEARKNREKEVEEILVKDKGAEEAKKIIAAGDVQLKRAIEEMNKKLKTVKK
jgi:protease